MNWGTTPEADADLIRGRKWIEADHPEAAQRFLATARECFDRLGQLPELGPLARLKGEEFKGLRFLVLDPPFNKWIVFYRVRRIVEILRVLYGTQDWRGEPKRFF
jgi:plasmid stabilization system protein ParE